jgi:GMP synthase-like glutamine amidotransferase
MNVDQEDEHPWLRREDEFVRGLLERGVPTLGFTRVELLDCAGGDPLFGALPREFEVWNAHGYAFHVPDGAVELARSPVCSQAFRLGDSAWGVQFHPEIRVDQVAHWLREDRVPNARELVEELRARYDSWRSFGAALLRSFLAAAAKMPARSG